MKPAQLYDGILKAMNDKEAIELIEKAKEGWENDAYQMGWFDGDMAVRNQKI